MTNGEAVNWLINLTADIGKAEHRDLWHYEQALYEIKEMLEQDLHNSCIWQYHPADEMPNNNRYVLLDMIDCFNNTYLQNGYYSAEINAWCHDNHVEAPQFVRGWWELPERPEVEE